jgi:hypothetical protein
LAILITQSATAVGTNAKASFLATGGTAPYVYTVLPGGAGGTINSSTGQYTGPAILSSDPTLNFDTIQVTDAGAGLAISQIFVGTPLLLLCDILRRELELDVGRVYLWDQKINQPTDSGLYIAVSVGSCKPFANSNRPASTLSGLEAQQSVNMHAVIDIDIISRGPAARDRKEEVIMALNSIYAQQQQNANSFYIAKLPSSFLNLSNIDGAAIPYRFRISVAMQYTTVKVKPSQYFDDFSLEEFVNA